MDESSRATVPKEILDRIDEFASTVVGEEFVTDHARKVRAPKIIHASPWGTHRYWQWEVALLDTPLIQRLRQIHQTAGALLTFPSCTHTRFEHTLGVTHQASRLFDVVKRRVLEDTQLGATTGLDVGDTQLRNIRMAALLHDCAHGPFSHVSEEIYSYCDDMMALTEGSGPFPKKHPHEIMAHLIVLSEPFRRFCSAADKTYDVEINVEWIADAIMQRANDPSKRYLTQIVNGPFDADKLDYIFRDGTFMGISQVIDLDRLWYGAAISKRDLPSCSGGGWERILALDHGATVPLEQIVFFKLMLFQMLYHHQKVRAVDCMIKGVVEYIRSKPIKFSFNNSPELTLQRATDFLWLTDQSFFALPHIVDDPLLRDMIHNIRYRRLFKRALVICKNSITEETGPAFVDLRKMARRRDVADHVRCREIAKQILEKGQ